MWVMFFNALHLTPGGLPQIQIKLIPSCYNPHFPCITKEDVNEDIRSGFDNDSDRNI